MTSPRRILDALADAMTAEGGDPEVIRDVRKAAALAEGEHTSLPVAIDLAARALGGRSSSLVPFLRRLHTAVGEGDVADLVAGLVLAQMTPSPAGPFLPVPEVEGATVGVVAVAEGSGLVEVFRLAGAQGISAGNADELLDTVESVAAEVVIVLPNEARLVPVADELDARSTKRVLVVPTRSLPQGLAAMEAYSPDGADVSALLEDMAAAASAVIDGELIQATRPATVPYGRIESGDWMGVADGTVVVVDADPAAALRGLVAAIIPPLAEALTMFTGRDASPAATKSLEAWLAEIYPDLDVVVVPGDHPEAAYLVSIS
jgi:dihydroxyacetone kinase-like predicted kinase